MSPVNSWQHCRDLALVEGTKPHIFLPQFIQRHTRFQLRVYLFVRLIFEKKNCKNSSPHYLILCLVNRDAFRLFLRCRSSKNVRARTPFRLFGTESHESDQSALQDVPCTQYDGRNHKQGEINYKNHHRQLSREGVCPINTVCPRIGDGSILVLANKFASGSSLKKATFASQRNNRISSSWGKRCTSVTAEQGFLWDRGSASQ